VGRIVDLLIAGGTVYRGDETEPTVVDIGITGHKIVFLGDARRPLTYRRTRLAHIKVTNSSRPDGEDMAEVIAPIEAAGAKGQNVTADQYPWAAANTGLEAVAIPRWAQAGGFEAMVKRFDNPADLAKIKAETGLAPGFAEKTMIGSAPKQPDLVGKRLSEIAANWGVDPTDASIRILRDKGAAIHHLSLNVISSM